MCHEHDFGCRIDCAAYRGLADMALQRKLGVLSERRIGIGRYCSVGIAIDWTAFLGRIFKRVTQRKIVPPLA